MNNIKSYLSQHIALCHTLTENQSYISAVRTSIEILSTALFNKQPILIFGNGGSAADAQHISAELVGKFKHERNAFNAICLNSNTSAITAIANDYSYDDIFSRQIEAFNGSNAVCFGITTSGKSANVIKGLETAKKLGYKSIALTGPNNANLPLSINAVINCPGSSTAEIQEMHVITYHLICQEIEKNNINSCC